MCNPSITLTVLSSSSNSNSKAMFRQVSLPLIVCFVFSCIFTSHLPWFKRFDTYILVGTLTLAVRHFCNSGGDLYSE